MRMLLTLGFLSILTGCASAPYGTLTGDLSDLARDKLVSDSSSQLASVWPPASTRLALIHASNDGFGKVLIPALRSSGYAVQESKEKASSGAAAGIPFSYVIDRPTDTNLYRVVLNVGNQSLMRAYVAQNDSVYPAGEWTRKE